MSKNMAQLCASATCLSYMTSNPPSTTRCAPVVTGIDRSSSCLSIEVWIAGCLSQTSRLLLRWHGLQPCAKLAKVDDEADGRSGPDEKATHLTRLT